MSENNTENDIYTPVKGKIVFPSASNATTSANDIYAPVKDKARFNSESTNNSQPNSDRSQKTNKKSIINHLNQWVHSKKKKK